MLKVWFIGWGLMLCSVMAGATEVNQLVLEMTAIQNSPEQLNQALEHGKERAQLCFHCHGKDGNSKRDYIPNLAQQNATYLFLQFEHFANGSRKDYVMSKLAEHLTDNDRIAIALYFANTQVKLREQPMPSSAEGKITYDSLCFVCHGESGHGSEQYPRIAGQPYPYLEKTLLGFLHQDRDRLNSPMMAVVQSLDEDQLKAVAAYVAHMP